MTLRFLAAFALILGAAALFGYLNLVGRGPLASPALRHLRTMKDRVTAPDSVTALSMTQFQQLPWRASPGIVATIERHGASYEGYVERMLRAMDDDVHLEMVEAPRVYGERDTVYVTAEITSWWRRGSSRWNYEALGAAFRANHGMLTPWDGGPRRVRVSGWLCYDFQYDERPSAWSLEHGGPRVSGWEIHPVTRIELWDDQAKAFVDYPR